MKAASIMSMALLTTLARRSSAFAPAATLALRSKVPARHTSARAVSSTTQAAADAVAKGPQKGDSNPERPKRISDEIEALLLEQAKVEMSASQVYLSMSYWFEDRGLEAYSKHFKEQSEEERGHCIEFLDYVAKRGGKVVVPSLPQPALEFEDPATAMTYYLDLERKVADSINDKYSKAMDARDWPTVSFLQPFSAYQIAEEEEADALAQKIFRLTKKGDLSQLLDSQQSD